MIEVGLGGDMTAAAEAEEWAEAAKDGKKKTTSCCPGICKYGQETFPRGMGLCIYDSITNVCSVQNDQGERAGSGNCIYRTMCC